MGVSQRRSAVVHRIRSTAGRPVVGAAVGQNSDAAKSSAEAKKSDVGDQEQPSLWCCQYELAGGTFWGPTSATGQHEARVLVRLHGQPLGYLAMPMVGSTPAADACRALALEQFGTAITAHLAADAAAGPVVTTDPTVVDISASPVGAADTLAARTAVRTGAGVGAAAVSSLPSVPAHCPRIVAGGDLVSVVVCTRDRGDGLRSCLARLRELTYEQLEIVIVDNAPSDDRTRSVVAAMAEQDARFRYVLEPRPGLSYARNRGLREARGRYLAYTDDDVMVDPGWIEGIVRGFRRSPAVGCVTGLVCTAAISNATEAYFDARSPSWSARFEPELFDMKDHRRDGALYPYSAGIFGTGANCAFDREMFETVGTFDEALGAGTKTKGGEDLDMFLRVLLAGRAIAYEPAAVVWHHHRADHEGLLKQMFGYGSGLTAFLTKCLSSRATRRDVVKRVLPGIWRMFAIKSDTDARLPGRTVAPRGALRQEVTGYLCGPILYARARRSVRQVG